VLTFDVARDDELGLELVPVLGRRPLVELVAAFESRRRFEPALGYRGLFPDRFPIGDRYFFGEADDQWPEPGRAWLLGCCCGEAGCWPFEARIEVGTDRVTWTDFVQPHRRERDYSDLGPFVFVREQYEDAVRQAVSLIRGGR
jgi:hypothetical protein